ARFQYVRKDNPCTKQDEADLHKQLGGKHRAKPFRKPEKVAYEKSDRQAKDHGLQVEVANCPIALNDKRTQCHRVHDRKDTEKMAEGFPCHHYTDGSCHTDEKKLNQHGPKVLTSKYSSTQLLPGVPGEVGRRYNEPQK